MKDPYQYERTRQSQEQGSYDTFERAPLDFHTEEERNHMAAEIERHRVAELNGSERLAARCWPTGGYRAGRQTGEDQTP